MPKLFFRGGKFSLVVLFVLFGVLLAVRFLSPALGTLSWDVFGYYMWIPAKFIQGDLWLDQVQWVQGIIDQYKNTETAYQMFIGPNGTWMYRYLFGMGYFYLPFFFIGHAWAHLGGYQTDGFSMPYQYSVAFGTVFYAALALIFCRKVLMRYFDGILVGLMLVILVAGTNYFYFASIGATGTPNITFTIMAALLWFTISWHDKPKAWKAILIGGLCGLAVAVKPSEAVCVLIPLLWPAEGGLKAKWILVKKYWWQWGLMIFIGILAIAPQLYYWKNEAGAWVYDSYRDPGTGIDYWSPHILEVLFSFRKGWLIYTPVMIFCLWGFYQVYKRNKKIFWPLFVYFVVNFYIVSSWSNWWYGASFGQRAMIASYPVLLISGGYFLQMLRDRKILRWGVGALIVAFVGLNLFQTWQYANYMIHPDRMSRAYYLRIFGSTSMTEEDQQLLLVDHSYGWIDEFKYPERYKVRNVGLYDFEGDPYPDYAQYYTTDTFHSAATGFIMDSTLEFSPEIRTTFSGLTDRDHAWIKASVWLFFPDTVRKDLPLLVVSTLYKGENYKYRTFLPGDIVPGQWSKVECMYQTPEIRTKEDDIVVYIWNRSKMKFYMDDLRVDAYTLR